MVIVYTQNKCPACTNFKAWLTRRDICFEEKNITLNEKFAEELFKLGFKGVPMTIIKSQELERTYLGSSTKVKKELMKLNQKI